MTLDELAAAVVMVEPGDSDELRRILDGLVSLQGSWPSNEQLQGLARGAIKCVEAVIAGESENPAEHLSELGLLIGRLQESLQAVEDEVAAGRSPVPSPTPTTAVSPQADANRELLAGFIAEALDHLQTAESALLELDSHPDSDEAIAAAFRAFHSIKGTAGFMGFDAIEKLAHRVESLLDRARDNAIRLSGEVADLALGSGDMLRQLVETLERNAGVQGDLPPEYEVLLERLSARITGAERGRETVPSVAQETPSAPPQSPPAPSDAEDLELLAEFITEAFEHLQRSENALLALEKDPDDRGAIDAVFRAFHTIKGSSGFLGLDAIQKLAHRAEGLLDRARKGEICIVEDRADLALASVDMLKGMIREVERRGTGASPPTGLADLVERLSSSKTAGPPAPERALAPPMERAPEPLMSPVAETGAPPESGGEPERAPKEPARQTAAAPATAPGEATKGTARSNPAEETVRVSTARLDNLINMVGELVITNAMMAQSRHALDDTDRRVSRNVSQLAKITRELQDLAISMRMVPLKATFNKMARLVRDLARKSGKSIQFVTHGEETEIDRNMVEVLSDPLVHLIRNALDHGIEPPQERCALKKPEAGTVTLGAFHAAGSVVIGLSDDGRGLDRERIAAKAIERGLIPSDADLGDADLFKLIFLPGFSTAEKVTDISGRGVGLDVVRRNIEAVRGRVEVASTRGAGTTFSLRIPLTLAIIDGMLLRVGGEHYIIPTLNVHHAFRPEATSVATVQGRGELVELRGTLIPLYRLNRLFEVPHGVEDAQRGIVIVVEHEGKRCALLVDELLGQQQVVIKSLGKGLGEVAGVSGAAILGDGRVGLILDVAGVIGIARSRGVSPEGTRTLRSHAATFSG
ncbi:MAG: Hpt domain-containing protein [Planctomycetota bacterium]